MKNGEFENIAARATNIQERTALIRLLAESGDPGVRDELLQLISQTAALGNEARFALNALDGADWC